MNDTFLLFLNTRIRIINKTFKEETCWPPLFGRRQQNTTGRSASSRVHTLSLFSFSFLRKKKKKRKKNKRGGRGEAKTVPAKGAGGAVERDAATAARRDRVRFRDTCARHFDAVWIRGASEFVAVPHAFAVGCAR